MKIESWSCSILQLLLLVNVSLVLAFAPSAFWRQQQQPKQGVQQSWKTRGPKRTNSLFGASSSSDSPFDPKRTQPNLGEHDLPTFLNQRSIQSFLFLLNNMRDLQTLYWVDDFTKAALIECSADDEDEDDDEKTTAESSTDGIYQGPKCTLMSYHGLGAMDQREFPTWDTYFSKLLDTPEETLLVESSSPWVQDYEVEIKPASICTRIISVREQIARECAHDLRVIANMGESTMERYWKAVEKEAQDTSVETQEDDMLASLNDDVYPKRRMEAEALFFLGNPISSSDSHGPSALRKGNYDLLLLLVTQESVLRLIQSKKMDPEASPQERCTGDFLKDFYEQRYHSHFEGNLVGYGRADLFLEELLFSAPKVMTDKASGATCLMDPIALAKELLEVRDDLALQWAKECEKVPEEHFFIRRRQLDCLMGIVTPVAVGSEQSNPVASANTTTSSVPADQKEDDPMKAFDEQMRKLTMQQQQQPPVVDEQSSDEEEIPQVIKQEEEQPPLEEKESTFTTGFFIEESEGVIISAEENNRNATMASEETVVDKEVPIQDLLNLLIMPAKDDQVGKLVGGLLFKMNPVSKVSELNIEEMMQKNTTEG